MEIELRDFFAGCAWGALISQEKWPDDDYSICEIAYDYADRMLEIKALRANDPKIKEFTDERTND